MKTTALRITVIALATLTVGAGSYVVASRAATPAASVDAGMTTPSGEAPAGGDAERPLVSEAGTLAETLRRAGAPEVSPIEVPVLEPLAVGDAKPETVTTDSGAMLVSRGAGSMTVFAPIGADRSPDGESESSSGPDGDSAGEAAVDAATRAWLETIGATGDPEGALGAASIATADPDEESSAGSTADGATDGDSADEHGTTEGGTTPDPARADRWWIPALFGDPCAPLAELVGAEGVVIPEECPDGTRATVLDRREPELALRAKAFPPTAAERAAMLDGLPSHRARLIPDVTCPAAPAVDNAVPLGIASNFPVSMTITYWPVDDMTNVHTATAATSEAQADAFFANREAGREPARLQHCLTLTDLEDAWTWAVKVTATDGLGRETWSMTWFNREGAPSHPTMKVTPVGDNLYFVTTPHAAGEQVVVRNGDCTSPGSGTLARPLTESDTVLSFAEVAYQNWDPIYNRSMVRSYFLDSGDTTQVCAFWLPESAERGWDDADVLYAASAVVSAPQRNYSMITLEELLPATGSRSAGLQSVAITAHTSAGQQCGRTLTVAANADAPVRQGICNGRNMRTAGIVIVGDAVSQVGFTGDVVLTVTATARSGRTSTTQVAIRSRDGGCRGDCELPAPAWFSLSLAQQSRLSGFGECRIGECIWPRRDESLGLITFRQSYHGSSMNGASAWSVIPGVDEARGYVAPDRPAMDTHAEWSVAPLRGGTGDVPTPRFTSASFPLDTDRPVDYRVVMSADFSPLSSEPEASCEDGSPLTASGHSDGHVVVTLTGLCIGRTYAPVVDLTDAEGNTSRWTPLGPDGGWANGALRIPTTTQQLDYRLSVAPDRSSAGWWFFKGGEVTIGGGAVPLDDVLGICQLREPWYGTRGTTTAELHSAGAWFEVTINLTRPYADNRVSQRQCAEASTYIVRDRVFIPWDDVMAGVRLHRNYSDDGRNATLAYDLTVTLPGRVDPGVDYDLTTER